MPTFNQLVRKGRATLADKSTAPALQKSYNSKKKEVAPDGSKDECVFDIMQGVAITLFVKNKQTDLLRPNGLRLFQTGEPR